MNPIFFSRICLFGVGIVNTYILCVIYDVVQNNNEILNEIIENEIK